MAAAALAAMAQGNLRYQTRYSKAQVSNIISKLETSSDKFRRDFDKAMDNSRYNGTSAEDEYNGNVRDFENNLDDLRREFNRTNSWGEMRNRVQNVVRAGETVNSMMNSISFRRTLERQWNTMRNDLNTLADTFDLPGLNGGGWTGGGGWNGGGNTGGVVPSWAVGSFSARNPQNGGTIYMNVQSNGTVTLTYDNGAPIHATMNGTILNNPPYQSRVSRINNGIRTTSTTGNDYIDYFRTTVDPGPGAGGGNTGGKVPSWAVGSFSARNPQNGGTIYMNVQSNGTVTLTYDNGAPIYATMNGTILNNPPYQSRVSRINNGIRTTSTTGNDYVDYFRTTVDPGPGAGGGGNVPNWAVGTFYATNPQNGGTIQLTVERNGTAIIVFDNGAPIYATVNGTILNNPPYQSRLSRINNGIRTTSTTNNQYIDYFRR